MPFGVFRGFVDLYKDSKRFVIEGELPDLNDLINKAKCHWTVYREYKNGFTDFVAYSCMSQKVGNFKKIDLEIVFYCKDRRKDKDNVFSGGIKVLLDGMVKAGVIRDDGWKCIGDFDIRLKVDKVRPRVEVLVKEV